ncbi:amino acid adenylation domain-containing protein [Verrucosispora sp. WMMD573]|uniref:amino acid adenylation domain-containing protein n=1 Tax=Verrucosispora sp. WMMD573 TaxID=3015149 RepID=UPI0032B1D1EF
MNQVLADLLRQRVIQRSQSEPTVTGGDARIGRTVPSVGQARSLVAAFGESVRCFSDRVAVRCGGRGVTFGELDRRAGVLAGAIRAAGVDVSRPVGVLLDRSVDMVAAVLAVLRVGSSYVPLDVGTPAGRLELIVDDADLSVVVTSGGLVGLLPEGVPAVLVDDEGLAGGPVEVAAAEPGGDDRAYVIFTSGTTGRPKGVQISHGNVLRLFGVTERHFGFGPDDVWAMFHSFAFDVSVWEMWGPLLYGGCLVIVPRETAQDPQALWDLLERERVTVLCQTPTALNQLIAEDATRDRRLPLRYVISAGEALHFGDLRPWVARYGDERPQLINMYGPTETTVYASYRRVRREDLGQERSLIGVPLADLRFTLVDADLNEVPAGQPGEIVISGPALSSGYLGSPRLNRARFVRLPATGERGYRSGDQAVLVKSGEYEYRGRQDDQVKIRGFRIELGEVETALRALGSVSGVAVVARELPQRGPTLVAYLVPSQPGLTAVALRRALATALPAYMIPSVFVVLDALPLNQNDKVDRRALPDPAQATLLPDTEHGPAPIAAPVPTRSSGDVDEDRVAQVVADLLGIERVDPQTSFFEFGGHSILAIRLVARIGSEFGVDIPLRLFLRDPTVRGLTQLVRRGDADGRTSGGGGIPLYRVPEGEPVPVTDPQGRLYYLAQLQRDSAAYNLHQTALIEGDLDVDALERAFRTIVDRHAALRTVLRLADSGIVQVVRPAGQFRMAVEAAEVPSGTDLTAVAERLSEQELRRPFDLEHDDMLRVRLIRLMPHRHALLISMHHVASDGWSIGILAREVGQLYRAFHRDSAADQAELPPLPVTYADYSYSVTRWADSPQAARDLGYWEERLRDLPLVHGLPLDRPRPVEATHSGESIIQRLDPQLTEAVRALARTSGGTPFVLLHAVFAMLLAKRSGSDDVVVGTPVANRNGTELDGLIGMFVNTLVRRTRVDDAPTFLSYVQHVREEALLDLDHQHVPLDMVVTRLNPARSTAHSPLFQIMFAYQDDQRGGIELDGLAVDLLPSPSQDTLAELMLDVFDIGRNLELRWHFNPDLFHRPTIQSCADEYVDLLRRALAEPQSSLAALLGREKPGARRLLALRRRPEGATPIYALPGVLGLGPSFAQLSAMFDDRSFFAVSTRELYQEGVDGTITALASRCAEVIAAAAGTGPVDLVGHSFGGALGLYVAHELRARGVPVTGLVALDSVDPEAVGRRLGTTRVEQLVSFLAILAEMFPAVREHAPSDLPTLLRTTPEEQILAEVQELIGADAPHLLNGDLTEVFDAFSGMSSLRWPPVTVPPDLSIMLIEAAHTRHDQGEQPRSGWQRIVGARLAYTSVAAGHEAMLYRPHVTEVAELMRRFLGQHGPVATDEAGPAAR